MNGFTIFSIPIMVPGLRGISGFRKQKGSVMAQEKRTKGIVNRGNWSRLKQCMIRASKGERIVVGFLGGSITQGSLAADATRCYAYLTFQWWKEKFPKADIKYVNGGIGGTSSLFGVARAEKDVLTEQPDVVFVDFSVNDDATEFFKETYEGVIRKLYQWHTDPAVVVLNNVFYDTGINAQEYHNTVAAHYEIPCVSIKESIYAEIQEGTYQAKDLTSDYLHPNDRGHALVAGELIKLLELVWEERDKEEKTPVYPRPLTANTYQNAVRYENGNSSPKLWGFYMDLRKKENVYDHFKSGWIGSKVGDRICFRVECGNLAVQYRKSVKHPAPIAKITVDGKAEDAMILDGSFDETWGDCLYLQPVLHHTEICVHEILIEIIEATDHDAEPFYLMSLICA